MNNSKDTTFQHKVQRRLCVDLADRSIPGIILYVLVWLAIIFPSMTYFGSESRYDIIYDLTAAVLGAALLRLVLVAWVKRHIVTMSAATIDQLITLGVIISSLAWGLSVAYLIALNTFQEALLPLIVSTAGICAGGSASLAPSRKLVALMLCGTLIPGTVALQLSNFPFSASMAMLCAIYILAMYSISNIQRKEYFNALLSNFKLEEQAAKLAELSTLDGLTGLRNRRFFEDRQLDEFRRAQRDHKEISLILLDLDHFKQINDQHGHLIGDECLREMARALTQKFNRTMDTLARVGGEEFAVLLPGTSLENAMTLADELRRHIASLRLQYADTRIQMTASLGVSTVRPNYEDSAYSLFERADSALYEAKRSGRNRVASAPVIDLHKARENPVSDTSTRCYSQWRMMG
ncbi:MAG: GGDEF domain-containing protein [Hahellaceae bacterium]|nr:GGDEF domain-containing protein [Hahellaceae bacterium]